MVTSWLIGKDPACDLDLNFATVSGLHALLRRTEAGQWTLEDLASSNGTFVNGQKISCRVVLNKGDQITLGKNVAVSLSNLPSAGTSEAKTLGRSRECDVA